MAITLTSVAHEFSTVINDAKAGLQKVEQFAAKLQAEGAVAAPILAKVASEFTGNTKAADIVRIGTALLGSVAQVLSTGEAAAEAKLKDAGLDTVALDAVKALLPTIKSELQAAGLVA